MPCVENGGLRRTGQSFPKSPLPSEACHGHPRQRCPKPQPERAQTPKTPSLEPKTRFGEYPGGKQLAKVEARSKINHPLTTLSRGFSISPAALSPRAAASRSDGRSTGWCESGCGRAADRSFPAKLHQRPKARQRCGKGRGCGAFYSGLRIPRKKGTHSTASRALIPCEGGHLCWAVRSIRRAPDPGARGHGQPRECATHVLLPAGSSG